MRIQKYWDQWRFERDVAAMEIYFFQNKETAKDENQEIWLSLD